MPSIDSGRTAAPEVEPPRDVIRMLDDLNRMDAGVVGMKAAQLGELLRAGFRVPPGFVVLPEARQLAPIDLSALLDRALRQLGAASVAVRSSGLLEDSASASHAGMLRTRTNVATRDENDEIDPGEVLEALHEVWRSAGSDATVAYREALGGGAGRSGAGIEDTAVVVQQMVTGEYSGVAFSVDPVSGDPNSTLVEVVRGPGSGLVDGSVQPHRFRVPTGNPHRGTDIGAAAPTATNTSYGAIGDGASGPTGEGSEPVLQVVRTVIQVQQHFGTPVDVEWCWDRGSLAVLQSRPVTSVMASESAGGPNADSPMMTGTEVILWGEPASPGVAQGWVRVLGDVEEIHAVQHGEVLVTRFTSPEWMPALLRAGALVTEVGGVTSHAAIVSRELGLPCVVGASDATEVLGVTDRVVVDGGLGTVSRP